MTGHTAAPGAAPDRPGGAELAGAVELLERALAYTLGGLRLVRPALLARPTPCAGWDLRALLRHLDDSLLALYEAASTGRVAAPADSPAPPGPAPPGPVPPGPAPPGLAPSSAGPDPVGPLKERASRLLGRYTTGGPGAVAVRGRPLAARVVVAAGALEVTVHGWDVARACGRDRPLPPPFAARLLGVARLLVDEADRPARFAPPVPVAATAAPGDRLLAFLGRDPAARSR